MVKKARQRALGISVLLLMLLMFASESHAGGVVNVHIYVEQGSVWNSPQGNQTIAQEKVQALLIWKSTSVKINLSPGVKALQGNPNQLTLRDMQNYAVTLKATARNIVVVFTNKSVSISRAWTEESLVKANTPVIMIGKEVLQDPGTYRDLAHELGHVLLRDKAHATGSSNLMNIGANVGEELSEDQKKKAQAYPCAEGATGDCPEIGMAPGPTGSAIIKEINQVGSQPSPTTLRRLTAQREGVAVKPYYWSQPSLPSLRSFTASRAQSQKQGIDTDISFVCSGGPVASYDEYATVKVLIGDQPIRSRLEYVPIGAQPLKVVTQPPPGDRGSWIVKEIKFQDVYGNGQWQTFTPNAAEANVSLNIGERRGTALSQLKIIVDQCGGPSSVTGANVVRNCTENEIEARRGMVLCEGDKCRTRSNSRAALDFLTPNRNVFATVTVSEASEIEVGGLDAGGATGAVLALDAGQVQSRVNNVSGAPVQFTVISPTVTVFSRGTVFTVRHDKQRQISTVEVREGQVEVTPANPTLQAFTLRASQQVQVAQNNVGPVTPITDTGDGNTAGGITGGTTGGAPAASGGATGAQRPPPSGIGGTWSSPTGDVIELVQDGNRITGRYRGILGEGEITGTFDGKNLAGMFRPNQSLIPLAVPFALTLLEDGKLVGLLETPLGRSPLSLTRVRR